MIRKVFKTFDKHGSGFIDISELIAVSDELGQTIPVSELDKCMKDID